MNKQDLWQAYVQANPEFLIEGVNLSAKGLRKFFDRTWSIAYKEGLQDGGEAFEEEPLQSNNSSEDLFLKDLMSKLGMK